MHIVISYFYTIFLIDIFSSCIFFIPTSLLQSIEVIFNILSSNEFPISDFSDSKLSICFNFPARSAKSFQNFIIINRCLFFSLFYLPNRSFDSKLSISSIFLNSSVMKHNPFAFLIRLTVEFFANR